MVQLDLPLLRLMRAPALLIALAAVFIAGCPLKPAPPQEETVRQAMPAETLIPPSWKAAPADCPVADGWLQSLNDPPLAALVAEALDNNLDLRQAAERVIAAQQTVVVVGAQLLPQVGVTLGGRALHDDEHNGVKDSSVAYASVAWEVDVWGKLRAQRASAAAGYEATALDYAYARQSLAATAARSWYLAIEARRLLAVAERAVSIYRELLKLVLIRQSAGKDTGLDVVNAQSNLESALSAVESAREAYGNIRRALEVLLGRYPAAEIEVAAVYPQLPAPPATGVPASLLKRRPDVVAAERVVLAAFRNTEAAQLALLPDFSIALIGGRWSDTAITLLRLNPWMEKAEIGISVPIYEGGKLLAQIKIANAQQAQAVARYGSLILKAFREVESTLANEQLLKNRVPFEEKALLDRTEAVRIATIQYTAGRRDLLWVSNLQSSQLSTEAELVRVRALQHLNRIGLLLALGGSFETVPATLARETP